MWNIFFTVDVCRTFFLLLMRIYIFLIVDICRVFLTVHACVLGQLFELSPFSLLLQIIFVYNFVKEKRNGMCRCSESEA